MNQADTANSRSASLKRILGLSSGSSFFAQSLITQLGVIAFLLLHIPLGIVFKNTENLSTIHAFSVIGITIIIALSSSPISWVAYLMAYIVGAEVLWRMTGASIQWEVGKYAVVLAVLLAVLRIRNSRIPLLPIIYILLLAPSSLMVLLEKGLSSAQSDLSFNLSGPLALFAATWFFSNIRLDQKQFQYLLIAIIAPIISIASIALQGIIANPNIVWSRSSNPVTSGGFGPNQVSAALGLGLLCAWLIFFTVKRPIIPRFLIVALAMWLATQALLTFSRGGFIGALVGIGASVVVAMVNRIVTLKMIVLTIAGFVLFVVFLYPQIDAFTGGALTGRYSNLSDTTGRDRIAEDEIQAFWDNPLWGVGPGQLNQITWDNQPAHTEYTRLLAEHGIFGLLALGSLGLMGVMAYLKSQRQKTAQMIIIACLFWVLFYLSNVAMRTVAVSFIFGLVFVDFSNGFE
jgi:O-antigen ligase